MAKKRAVKKGTQKRGSNAGSRSSATPRKGKKKAAPKRPKAEDSPHTPQEQGVFETMEDITDEEMDRIIGRRKELGSEHRQRQAELAQLKADAIKRLLEMQEEEKIPGGDRPHYYSRVHDDGVELTPEGYTLNKWAPKKPKKGKKGKRSKAPAIDPDTVEDRATGV